LGDVIVSLCDADKLSVTYLGETMNDIVVETLTGDTSNTQCHFIFENASRRVMFSYIPGETSDVTFESVTGSNNTTVNAWVLRLSADDTRAGIVPAGEYKLFIFRGVLTGSGVASSRNEGYVVKEFRMPDSGVPFGPGE
jgi:hypothetical protein